MSGTQPVPDLQLRGGNPRFAPPLIICGYCDTVINTNIYQTKHASIFDVINKSIEEFFFPSDYPNSCVGFFLSIFCFWPIIAIGVGVVLTWVIKRISPIYTFEISLAVFIIAISVYPLSVFLIIRKQANQLNRYLDSRKIPRWTWFEQFRYW
jgi:hypothetical protein